MVYSVETTDHRVDELWKRNFMANCRKEFVDLVKSLIKNLRKLKKIFGRNFL